MGRRMTDSILRHGDKVYVRGQRLGRGAMAEVVIAALQGVAGFEKIVAIKQIFPHLFTDDRYRRMFLDEAKVVASLRHPNIVEVYDLHADDHGVYIIMEYVRGISLGRLVDHCVDAGLALPVPMACRIIADVASALECAHGFSEAGGGPSIVHRDVNPNNIMVGFDGVVKLLDFGIAREEGRATLTETGCLKGTAGYFAPEMLEGARLDERADVFSLGVVMHELLTGQPLFGGASLLQALHQQLVDRPIPKPSTVNAEVPEALDSLVLKALARDPQHRLPRAGLLAECIEHHLETTGSPVVTRDLATWAQGTLPTHFEALKVLERETQRLGRAACRGTRERVVSIPDSPFPYDRLDSNGVRNTRGAWLRYGAVVIVALAIGLSAAAAWILRQHTAFLVAPVVSTNPTQMVTINTTPAGLALYDLQSGRHLGLSPVHADRLRAEVPLQVVAYHEGVYSNPFEIEPGVTHTQLHLTDWAAGLGRERQAPLTRIASSERVRGTGSTDRSLRSKRRKRPRKPRNEPRLAASAIDTLAHHRSLPQTPAPEVTGTSARDYDRVPDRLSASLLSKLLRDDANLSRRFRSALQLGIVVRPGEGTVRQGNAFRQVLLQQGWGPKEPGMIAVVPASSVTDIVQAVRTQGLNMLFLQSVPVGAASPLRTMARQHQVLLVSPHPHHVGGTAAIGFGLRHKTPRILYHADTAAEQRATLTDPVLQMVDRL